MAEQRIPEWVTVKVAAALVGKAQRTVYRWIDRGLLATRYDRDGRVMVLSKAVGRVALEQRRGRPRGVPTRR
jgi:predicted site-specific integrase-resolvase